MRELILSAFFLLAILSSYPLFSQEIYHWTDEDGVEHYTDDLGQVPDPYRPKYSEPRAPVINEPGIKEPTKVLKEETLEEPYPTDVGTEERNIPQQISQEAPKEIPQEVPSKTEPRGNQTADEAYWKNRIAETKQKLEDRQNALTQAYDTKRKIYEQFYPGSHARLAEVQAKIDSLQKEIGDLKTELNVNIPKEAKEAGVPPGWLR